MNVSVTWQRALTSDTIGRESVWKVFCHLDDKGAICTREDQAEHAVKRLVS